MIARILTLAIATVLIVAPQSTAREADTDASLSGISTQIETDGTPGSTGGGSEIIWARGDGLLWWGSEAERCTPPEQMYAQQDPTTGELNLDVWICSSNQPVGPTPGQIAAAFRALQWPKAALSVEPSRGYVIINRHTNLYTSLTAPSTKSVTLLGVKVTIEATPVRYQWHSGVGQSWTTSSPGHVDAGTGSGDVWVEYRTPKQTVNPSVDVVYQGRYRIGGGGWIAIPDTLTVLGPQVSLITQSAQATLTR